MVRPNNEVRDWMHHHHHQYEKPPVDGLRPHLPFDIVDWVWDKFDRRFAHQPIWPRQRAIVCIRTKFTTIVYTPTSKKRSLNAMPLFQLSSILCSIVSQHGCRGTQGFCESAGGGGVIWQNRFSLTVVLLSCIHAQNDYSVVLTSYIYLLFI